MLFSFISGKESDLIASKQQNVPSFTHYTKYINKNAYSTWGKS